MSRVLVTAGAGTIGRALAELLLEQGHEPVILDTRSLPASLAGARHIVGRAVDADALAQAAEGCEHIYHLEWSGSVHRTTQEPLATNAHNTTATLLALETARRLSIPLIFSSTSVYRGDVERPYAEDDPKSERSLYVAQKLYAENCVRTYALLFGVPTSIFRVFNVYGGADPKPFQIVPRLMEAVRSGSPIKLTGDGGQQRDFVHISDVAQAFAGVLGKDLKGEAFNVGTGVGTSMLQLTHLIMELSGKTVPIEFVPALGEESRYIIADPSKSSEVLGFTAEVDLRSGLGRIFS